ncbi:MAG: hypothetical protein AB4352_26815 [Hormoscilla sp.]
MGRSTVTRAGSAVATTGDRAWLTHGKKIFDRREPILKQDCPCEKARSRQAPVPMTIPGDRSREILCHMSSV